jgi:hypothetical protein
MGLTGLVETAARPGFERRHPGIRKESLSPPRAALPRFLLRS